MSAPYSSTRRTAVTFAKFALAAAILAYLVMQAHDGFLRISQQRIHWPMLIAGVFCTFAACTCSFVRWHLLICALGIDMRLVDSLKLGSLGLALNFVSPGSIGGDFFKAVFLAHGNPGRRTEAVATVVADRVLGLLTMLVFASVGILTMGFALGPFSPLRVLCRVILITAIVCWTGVTLLLAVPALSGLRIMRWVASIPVAGAIAVRLLGAVQTYRSQKRTLLAAFAVSGMVAVFFISSFYFVARGLPIEEPSWTEHLVIVPVAGLVGAIPLTPSGLGTLELAVEELYRAVPGGVHGDQGDGTLVALTRRVTELAVALVGLVFYLLHRREVDELYAEAEEAA